MIKNKTGAWGEVYAARYLRDNKYKIISTNYSCRFGEIDIIAFDGKVLCFVEVKTRDKDTLHRPMEAVDEGKQQRLEQTAKSFISYTKYTNETRFDVCEVWLDDEYNLTDINYIKNAF